MTSTYVPGRELAEGRLETCIAESKPAFDSQGAVTEANRCLYCFDAPCIKACPTTINVPEFIRKIATGNLKGAARTILSANILGHSCARVCPVEVLCQGACVLNLEHEPPVQIGRLQRYATDYVHEQGIQLFTKGAPTGRRVAVIGAGPAGLACAHELALMGHQPVILEARPYPGGLNTTGVAPYKMHAQTSLEEVSYITGIGIEIQHGVEVGKDVRLEQLERDYDAIFLGVGLGPDGFLTVPGERMDGVVGATHLIERIKLDPELDLRHVRRAAVIGGGNTAIDVVRELRKLDVPEVTLVYRRGEPDMAGYAHEWRLAKEQGVRSLFHTLPAAIMGDGQVQALRCVKVAVLDNGRVAPLAETGFEMPVDLVVFAVGQEKLSALFHDLGIEFRNGRVAVDPTTFQTSHPKIFAGGDCINGGKEVVNAAADGKAAARAIDAYMKTQGRN